MAGTNRVVLNTAAIYAIQSPTDEYEYTLAMKGAASAVQTPFPRTQREAGRNCGPLLCHIPSITQK